MPLIRYRVAWSNWPGAPGVSTHYFSTSVADFSPVRAFYLANKDLFPNLLTWTFPTSYDVINEVTGQLSSTVATAPQTAVSSAHSATAYSGTSGAVLRWSTNSVVNGNKVVGRTYLVPLAQDQYFTDGSLVGTFITTVTAAATALLAAYGDGLKVWARPFPGRTNDPGGKPDIPARVGSFHTVVAATVPDFAAVMRSRRI